MGQRSDTIVKRFRSFSDEVIAFVENLSDKDWTKVCEWEQWTVGVTARHLGAGHFAIFGMADMIVRGEELPQLTMDQVNEMSKEDARAHTDCTKEEALEYLRTNSARMAEFISGLSDDALDQKGNMPAFGGEFTTEQFMEFIIFENAAQHFDSMKAAVAG